METAEKFFDCKKEDVMRKVPDHFWCDWLEHASDEDRTDEGFMKKIILRRGECLKFAPDSMRSDRNLVLKVVKNCPSAFVYASDGLQNDRKFVKQAVNLNAEVIKYVSDKFKNDKSVSLLAVRKNGVTLAFLSGEMQSDPDVVLAAVTHCGAALQFASDELKDDKDIVLTAIGSYDALRFASARLCDDKETVLAAIRSGGEYAIGYASERRRHDPEVIRTVLDTFPGQFENLPEDVQDNLEYALFGLESVVKHLPDPENYTFWKDSTSEYYVDYDHATDDFLDILESISREVLRKDADLNERVCRLAVEMDNAYYEGSYPYQDLSTRIVSLVEDLYAEKDIPLRPVLKEAIDALRRKSEEIRNEKYKHLDAEDRLFYENLDMYERIVGRSVADGGAEREREYLHPDGGFVKNCMTSFVKDLVYAQNGLYHDSALWKDDNYAVDLDKAYEEIASRLSPKTNVVRKAYEYYYSENVTVEVTGNIHLILVRAVPLKIMEIWVNKHDSEHEHGKWLAPDRLGEFCDMVEHIRDIYGKYEELALKRAAELRERIGL